MSSLNKKTICLITNLITKNTIKGNMKKCARLVETWQHSFSNTNFNRLASNFTCLTNIMDPGFVVFDVKQLKLAA